MGHKMTFVLSVFYRNFSKIVLLFSLTAFIFQGSVSSSKGSEKGERGIDIGKRNGY